MIQLAFGIYGGIALAFFVITFLMLRWMADPEKTGRIDAGDWAWIVGASVLVAVFWPIGLAVCVFQGAKTFL